MFFLLVQCYPVSVYVFLRSEEDPGGPVGSETKRSEEDPFQERRRRRFSTLTITSVPSGSLCFPSPVVLRVLTGVKVYLSV